MCRIFGMSYGDVPERLTTAEMAMIMYPALVHQGPHAWGWMSTDENFDGIDWEKTPGRCDTRKAQAQQAANIDPNPRWFVGHVRYATHGKPEDNRNNHPIPHDNIVGVHNGVLKNHDRILDVTGREDPKAIVDSEAIFAAVNKWGHKKGLSKIEGAMVTVYADVRKPKLLYIGRTQGRQLSLGFTTRGNLIFASEEQALRALMPDVEFASFSTIRMNRLLIVREGKIVNRMNLGDQTYVPPPARRIVTSREAAEVADWFDLDARPPTAGTALDRILASARVVDVRDEEMARNARAAHRAVARGSAMFPTNVRTTEDRRRQTSKPASRFTTTPCDIVQADGTPPPDVPKKKRQHNQNEKLYYYKGELLTHDEYVEVLADEEADQMMTP